MRTSVCGVVLFFFALGLAHGSDRTIAQFVHTAWGEKEGAPAGIRALAQTPDGYLWLGTGASGLWRFDGVRFESYQPRSPAPFPAGPVYALLSLPNGDLWIGFNFGAISLLRDGCATHYSAKDGIPAGRVLGLAGDRDGAIWAATSSGLARFDGRTWSRVESDWKFPGRVAHAVFVDRDGTLWVATEDTLVILRTHSRTFERTGIAVGYVARIVQARNGRLWMAETSRSVRPVPWSGDRLPPTDTEIQVGSVDLLFDREDALWVTSLGDGLRRAAKAEQLAGRIPQFGTGVENVTTTANGLTDDHILAILQDREGIIWAGTNSGLDQFRPATLSPVDLMIDPAQASMAPGVAGDVWVATRASTFHVERGTISKTQGFAAYSAYRDPRGGIWWTQFVNLVHFDRGRVSNFSLPEGLSMPRDVSVALRVTEDREGVLWVAAERHGLYRLKEKTWTRFELPSPLADLTPAAAFTDSKGRLWFGYWGGTIIVIDGNAVRQISSGLSSAFGDVGVINGRGEHVWVGGERGLAIFDGQGLRPVAPADAPTFGRISGIEETADGALWLCETRGVIHIAPADVQRSLREPAYRVPFQMFDALDGLPGTFRGIGEGGRVVQGSDGRLWFMASRGLAWLDPAALPRNAVPPPVVIRSIAAAGTTFTPSADLTLPPRSATVRIDYTALSLTVPERVRFRYRLDGSDKEWQDAGIRREAIYTNLGPRTYRFRVIASNNDGVWNETGATLAFTIAPAWYQTWWFMSLNVCAGVAIIAGAYRLRVRQLGRAMRLRFDERLAERTRVARDLHDTFLQTVQGSKLVADHALKNTADQASMVHALEQLSEWLGRATAEGRAALNSLRTPAIVSDDLPDAFRRLLDECRELAQMDGQLFIVGQPKRIHALVCDEAYRIGEEAIRNAYMHSGGTRVEVTLEYGPDLIVRVSDNGVGLDPAISELGKPGHFGISSIRERSARIGAVVTFASVSKQGTVVTLAVPGPVAFRSQTGRLL